MGATSSSLPGPSVPLAAKSDSLNSGKSRTLASTIKKRFSKKSRRFPKQLDYSKILRDFLSTWSTENLIQLVQDYEKSSIVKDYHLQAELARPTVSNVSEDLTKLYEKSEGTDVYLEYKGTQFSVHKSILCARCPLFRELLGKIYTFGSVVPIQIDMPEITTDLFSDLLRYLYSGEIRGYADADFDYQTLFRNLSKHAPNDLEFDLRYLLDTGIYSDVKLVFRNASAANPIRNASYSSTSLHSAKSIGKSPDDQCTACSNPSEYSCHAAVLAARSRFFRNIILRYQEKNLKAENQTINTAKQSIRIVLDERLIPKRYIGAVLNAIYCDGSNILNLLPNCVCKCRKNSGTSSNLLSTLPSDENCSLPFQSSGFSANNTPTTPTNPFASTISNLTGSTIFQTISGSITSAEAGAAANKSENYSNYINEIIDLFVIGKFLEVPALTSLCETLLVDAISLETVIGLLVWSERSNGSEFVRRQCLCFLREEYSTVATSKLLLQLSETQLIELIKSDFLQASEYEVLCSIFRWVESRLERDLPTTRRLDRRTRFSEEDSGLNSSVNSSHSTGSIKLNGSSSNGFSSVNSPSGQQSQAPKKCKRLSIDENADLERLRAMIGVFAKYLRIAHILPLENDLLKNALKNELITTLPPYMLNDDQTLSYERGIMAWINLENRPNFVKPRFFQPFYEEARLLLDERLTRFEEISFNDKKSSFNFPDNLYMVNENLSQSVKNKLSLGDFNEPGNSQRTNQFAELDLNGDRRMIRALKDRLLTNRMQVDLDYLDKETKSSIRQRNTETYLRVLPTIRALNLEEKYEILIYIQLKILREHNLPDEMLFIFEQDEHERSEPPLPTKQERCLLNMNLKRRSLKSSRRFSLNSVDLENYLSYESAENYKYHLEQDEDNLFLRGLHTEPSTGDYYEILHTDDANSEVTSQLRKLDEHELEIGSEENALNGPLLPPPDYRSTYNETEFPNKEQEISLDVFI